jgi:hypothetical protein
MATKNPESADRKVLVLYDCWAGKSGQVVTLPAADADRLVADGAGDDNAACIAAREA